MNQTPHRQPPAGPGPTPITPLAPPPGPAGYGQPFVQYQSPAHVPFPTPPRPPSPTIGERLARAAESGLIGKILAGVGVAITLAGIVMLLVLAAQAGLLRPEVRVAGGGALAALLVGLGIHVGRTADRRSGAIALVATGVAALLFDVLAMSAIYHWLPPAAALAVAGAVAGLGLGLAYRWDSQALTLMVSIPMLVLAPFVAGADVELLTGFLVVYAAAALWVQVGRDWPAVYGVDTLAVAAATLALVRLSDSPMLAAGLSTVGVLLALGSAVLLVRSVSQSEIVAVVGALAVLPVVYAVGALDDGYAAAAPAVCSAAYLAAAFSTARFVTRFDRTLWLVAGLVALAVACGRLVDGDYQTTAVLAAGLVLVIAAPFTADLALAVRIAGTGFAGVGLLLLVGDGGVRQMLSPWTSATDAERVALLIAGLVGMIAVALITWSWTDAADRADARIITVGALTALWPTTTALLAAAALIGGAGDDSFRAGHAAATVVWGVAAGAALLWARRCRGTERIVVLAAGLTVMAAAVAKLFLFDLAALDGVFRVAAFIVIGLVLLGLGVSYAQRVGDHDAPTPAA